MVHGHKQYSRESHPVTEMTYRITNPTEVMREELKRLLALRGESVTWYDCQTFENEWEATFDAHYEETFWDWAGEFDLEFWMVSE